MIKYDYKIFAQNSIIQWGLEMNKNFEKIILKSTKSKDISTTEDIQNLWEGYGKIIRYNLKYSSVKSIIAKNICIPKQSNLNNSEKLKMKIKSYKIEIEFYNNWSSRCSEDCRIPKCYAFEWQNNEGLIVLEDLDESGFTQRRNLGDFKEMELGLKWLANFHSTFMNETPKKLWTKGTYWNYDTRLDDLKRIKDIRLRNAAKQIDTIINNSNYKTIVHGDAKIQNFCFSKDNQSVAALDFQYVGGGCGMRDIAYFIDSCISPEEAESWENDILDIYFNELKNSLTKNKIAINFKEIEKEWRYLYQFAWVDFYRFVKGWAPGRYENDYCEKITKNVLDKLSNCNSFKT